MFDELERIKKQGLEAINSSDSLKSLEAARVALLGKKGELTEAIKTLGSLDPLERPKFGKVTNEIKELFESSISSRRTQLEAEDLNRRMEDEAIDISLPGRLLPSGRAHLISQVIDEISEIFIGLGYFIAEGPEVETDYYNFDALNTPVDHPARSLMDTLYMEKKGALLRTHTSPVQIRTMKKRKPPLYMISHGRVYRRDVSDPSHSPMFHQVEGLAVDKNITFGDLKGTLEVVAKKLFSDSARVRLRPHFFPFTEPSAEVDVACIICKGSGCRVCSGSGWLEILGSGMVDPKVLSEVGYDPEELSGFAFGMGVERIAMLKYGVSDIRLFFENDLRFLRQF
ncbi:MAG: phenylalanine--tRNA ligase subunit alpha [Actinomycetota bacterium]|nr:phenylalanine--tRNA ligase subunit alpha [Actinomycetota bacterium]